MAVFFTADPHWGHAGIIKKKGKRMRYKVAQTKEEKLEKYKKRLKSYSETIDELRHDSRRSELYVELLEAKLLNVLSTLRSIASMTVFEDSMETYKFCLDEARRMADEAIPRAVFQRQEDDSDEL